MKVLINRKSVEILIGQREKVSQCTLGKHAYAICSDFKGFKMMIVWMNKFDIFFNLLYNMDYGYTLEPPH